MPEADCLLHVLTARGRVSMPSLREIVSELDAARCSRDAPDTLRTYKLARLLDMLGHVEYLQQGRSSAIVVAPACLALLPSRDRMLYVLCGARSAAAGEEIAKFTLNGRKTGQVSVSSRRYYPDPLAPNRLTIEFEDGEKARITAHALGIKLGIGPTAWALACISGSSEDFENSLTWRGRTLRNDELKFYDAEMCAFTLSEESGGLAVRLDDPSFACIVRGDQEAVVRDLDWGRWWAHAEAGTSCLRYDRNRRLFAVPSRLPLPRLIARSLALCSGLPPIQTELKLSFASTQWLIFRDIPKEVALKVTEKLGLPAAPASLNELDEVSR